MNFKTFLFSLSLIVGVSQISYGQRSNDMMRMTPEQRLEQANSKMDSVVSLTPDQKTAVNYLHEELYLKDVPERGSMRDMSDEQREAFITQRRAKMNSYKEGLAAVLSEEQMEKWRTYEEARGGQRRQRGKTNRGKRKRGQ